MYGYYFYNILPMLAQALVMVETKSIRGRVQSWTIFLILDEVSNIERVKSKHRPIFLIYTSEHLLDIWMLLLSYIADANTGTCHYRDEINLRSSSILDHFPNIRRSNSC